MLFVVAGEFVESGIVGNQKAFEAEFGFQKIGKELFAGGAMDAVPTAIRRHDGGDAGVDGWDIAGQMDAAKVASSMMESPWSLPVLAVP